MRVQVDLGIGERRRQPVSAIIGGSPGQVVGKEFGVVGGEEHYSLSFLMGYASVYAKGKGRLCEPGLRI